MRPILRGEGEPHYNSTPLLEKMIRDAIAHRGVPAAADKDALQCSTWQESALDRAGENGTLFEVIPQKGAKLFWLKGAKDFLMDFSILVNRMAVGWETAPADTGEIVRDTRGDCHTLEHYLLKKGRAAKKIELLIYEYLRRHPAVEVDASSGPEAWADHEGEIWVSGPVELIKKPVSDLGICAP